MVGFIFQKVISQNPGLLPLTVKQISEAAQRPSDDTFSVDSVDVNNVLNFKLLLILEYFQLSGTGPYSSLWSR